MRKWTKTVLLVAGLICPVVAGGFWFLQGMSPPPQHVNEAECPRCEEITETCSEVIREWFETERFRDYTLHAFEGERTRERQEVLYQEGRTKALFGKSAHNYSPSRALDVHYIIKGVPKWDIWRFKALANRMPPEIEWGGHWTNFVDGPHFQEKHWTNSVKDYPHGS